MSSREIVWEQEIKKTRICLTGATGFIGHNLLSKLKALKDIEIIALSRKISPEIDGAKKDNVIWRRCNGFSLLDVEAVTQDCDVLIYLIHSMLPTSTLAQGSFADFDMYLADNFAKAASKNKVKKIIYLSGIIPSQDKLSQHLESRLEVEKVLAQYNNNLTVLRAGLIIGKNGSSFKILERLIKRLPLLICPSWTQTLTQPIDIEDVLASIIYCLNSIEALNPVYDIGGPDILTYREMLAQTAQVLNKKRIIINVPFFSPKLSKFWVSNITSTSKNLVYPLIDSLKYPMVADNHKKLIIPGHCYTNFKQALRLGISRDTGSWMRIIINYNTKINLRWLENVTSFQRLNISLIKNINASEIASIYFKWLGKFLKPFVSVCIKSTKIDLKFLKYIPLLELDKSTDRSSEDRALYYVKGGVLARSQAFNGRIEFRYIEATNSILVALLDFRPSLPWFIYKYTQAIIHLLTMNRFQHFIKKKYSTLKKK